MGLERLFQKASGTSSDDIAERASERVACAPFRAFGVVLAVTIERHSLCSIYTHPMELSTYLNHLKACLTTENGARLADLLHIKGSSSQKLLDTARQVCAPSLPLPTCIKKSARRRSDRLNSFLLLLSTSRLPSRESATTASPFPPLTTLPSATSSSSSRSAATTIRRHTLSRTP